MPAPSQGQFMVQQLQQLMQDPQAMQAIMQGAQQMGIPPEMLQQLAAGGMGGDAMMQGGGGGEMMPPDMGGAGPSGEGEMPPDMEGGGSPEQMVEGEIDGAGYTWDGVDAPTENDIERLMADPSPEAIASFNAQFGEGAAEQYMGSGETPDEEFPEGDETEAKESSEY